MINVLVTFPTDGHVHRMALAVVEGAESVHGTTVRLCRIAELEEARKALSAQDADRGHRRHRPISLRSPTTICAGPTASPGDADPLW